MTHPESGVLDAIAELEAEEAAQPRRPWWTSYEEAAERGAVIDRRDRHSGISVRSMAGHILDPTPPVRHPRYP